MYACTRPVCLSISLNVYNMFISVSGFCSLKVGYSPLLTACDYQNVKTVKYLAGRSDVDFSDFAEEILGEGDTERRGQRSGLHISAIHDSHEIAAILVEKGCKIDLKDLKVLSCRKFMNVCFSCRKL